MRASFAATAAPAQTAAYKVIHRFIDNTYVSNGGLTDVGGLLYGTLSGGPIGNGAVFSVSPHTGAATILYAFQAGSDGNDPVGKLLNVSGTLYGVTEYGGSYACNGGCGTIFSVSPKTAAEAIVYSFQGGMDGDRPEGGLIDYDGVLYGTTEGGAKDCTYSSGECGTVFSVDRATGTEHVLHLFRGFGDSGYPAAKLLRVGKILFGTDNYGGAFNDGSLFSFDLFTDVEVPFHSFGYQTDGTLPGFAGLIDVGGTLYGTTGSGGLHGYGVVFSLDPKTRAERVLYSFQSGSDGATPLAGLVDVRGTLYGTTFGGGSTACSGSGCGTVFSLNPATGVYRVLHVFRGGSDGGNPAAGLLDLHGTLYGTTTSHGGTVFALTP